MICSEAEVAKIPLISFGTDPDASNMASYKVEGNFKNASNKNIFFIGLNFLFKTPVKTNSKHF